MTPKSSRKIAQTTPYERQYGSPITPEQLAEYTILSQIGEGSFATIYQAENLKLPEDAPTRCLAIKRFKPEHTDIGENEARIMVDLFPHNESGFCINFFSGFLTKHSDGTDDCYLILLELLNWSRPLTLTPIPAYISPQMGVLGYQPSPYYVLAKLSLQLLNGLVEIHERNYTQCDIKPENIIYVEDNVHSSRIKIIDFGNSSRTSDLRDYSDDFQLQPIGYRAPEVIIGDPTMNEKIDVWGVGVVLLELLVNNMYKSLKNEWRLILSEGLQQGVMSITKSIESFDVYRNKRTLFWTPELESDELIRTGAIPAESVTIQNLAAVMVTKENRESTLALDFLLCLLRVDHRLRWSAAEALRHPFLVETLQGAWANILFPDRTKLPSGTSQLEEFGLL